MQLQLRMENLVNDSRSRYVSYLQHSHDTNSTGIDRGYRSISLYCQLALGSLYFDGRTVTLRQIANDKLVAKCLVVDGLYQLQIAAPKALAAVML
jgi:hypothetical protein